MLVTHSESEFQARHSSPREQLQPVRRAVQAPNAHVISSGTSKESPTSEDRPAELITSDAGRDEKGVRRMKSTYEFTNLFWPPIRRPNCAPFGLPISFLQFIDSPTAESGVQTIPPRAS